MILYAGQLVLTGHWVMAMATLVLTGWMAFAMRRMLPGDSGAPRRLLLAAVGRLHVATIGGQVEAVVLAPESLWLGSTILLVLRAEGRKHRLLLGPGNLDAPGLATLRRRLRGAAVPADPAVDSPAVSGKGVSVIEHIIRGVRN